MTSKMNLFSKERQGISLHRKQKYEKAFEKLYETAQWGLKDSQYFLAIMFLKGQFVEQDTVKGMGYLGVANEADIKKRKELFDAVYSTLSSDVKLLVDKRVEEYISKIGVKAKSIKCSELHNVGSRVAVVNCDFYKVNIKGGQVD
ncbi:MAG: hypothetical protein L3J83_03800 [Proteobacteria bacterium]|nr:hypothetical protein [Pseudomonadota bacterium]